MVPGPSSGGTGEEGEETNETCLMAAGLPGRLPGSLPRRRWLPGVASSSVQALRWLTETILSRDDEGAGPCRMTV
jgi:hypothetical protein